MDEKKEIMIVDERSLKDKIYVIRGQQVMLDFDIAEIYGYTTKAFNQQVRRNKIDSRRISCFALPRMRSRNI